MFKHLLQLSVGNLRNSELERRVALLTGERNILSGSLDEAQDRILVLERHSHEHQLQVWTVAGQTDQLNFAGPAKVSGLISVVYIDINFY